MKIVFVLVALALPIRASAAATTAIPASDFLHSVGINTTFPDRGQPIEKTVGMINYVGFRWVRGSIEGMSEERHTTVQTYLNLHKQTGVVFSLNQGSGGVDLKKLIATAHELAAADALLALEGNNEPNNWGITYEGEQGGGHAPSWMAVAKLQRDMYQAVKNDPVLSKYPVWSISEGGAERDNVGLQFLTIPDGAGCLMPDGTKFADFACVHNYFYHPNSPFPADNKTWNAADPTKACRVDGLFGNYGVTWAHHFAGYSQNKLLTLPRVTTETGCTITKEITEETQALNMLSLYLDQFKRGWSYTSVYLLRDRTDEGGNQTFGFFRRDYTPRKAAIYLHNLMSILADTGSGATGGRLDYAISQEPETMHDLLLQKADGTLDLVIWNERVKGADTVIVRFGSLYPSVKIYDPTVSTEPIEPTGQINSLKLSLSDHPLIIAIPQK